MPPSELDEGPITDSQGSYIANFGRTCTYSRGKQCMIFISNQNHINNREAKKKKLDDQI
jgi:hypothetical protein